MLLLVSGVLQADSGEDGQDGGGLQDRDQGLRGLGVQQGLLRLQVSEVSRHWDESSVATGIYLTLFFISRTVLK